MNTKIRIDIDGELDYNALKPLLKQLETMINFDFIVKVNRIKITNPSFGLEEPGAFDDNNYFGPIKSKKEIER